MSRHVFQVCPVLGDAEEVAQAFADDPGRWLPEPAEPTDESVWRVRLSAGRVARDVEATVGEPVDEGEVTWRTVSWQPAAESGLDRFLPAFDGELGFRPAPPGTLIVQGEYAPPGGALGEAIDALALHRVADRTMNQLVVAVARRLQRLGSNSATG